MIHGPCGALNEKSPCMAKGRCTKQYPRLLEPNTITGNDGYPQYRRSTEDGGKTAIIKKRNGTTIEVENQWVVHFFVSGWIHQFNIKVIAVGSIPKKS